ncbi:MAG: hypothetical protein ACYSSP_10595 [Planctomycetota bacterium]|jgi:hypothetical protein
MAKHKKQKITLKDLQEEILLEKLPPFNNTLQLLERYLMRFEPKDKEKHIELFNLAKLYMDVVTSFSIAVEIARRSIRHRSMKQMEILIKKFVQNFFRLNKYEKQVDLAYKNMSRDKLPDNWQISANAGVKFGRETGYSAFLVASNFTTGIQTWCTRAQKDVGINPRKYGSLEIAPKLNPDIIKWMLRTNEFIKRYFPNERDWQWGQIGLDFKSIIYKIFWEFTNNEKAYWDEAVSKGESSKQQLKLSKSVRAFEFLLKDQKLTDTESNMLEALGSDTLKGPELLKKAGYDNSSHYRAILSNLVKRYIIGRNQNGYFALSAP